MFYKYPCSTAKACVAAGPGTQHVWLLLQRGHPVTGPLGTPGLLAAPRILSVPAVLCIIYTLTCLCMPGIMQWCYPSLHAWPGTCGHTPGTEQSCGRGAHASPRVPMKCGSWGRRQTSLVPAQTHEPTENWPGDEPGGTAGTCCEGVAAGTGRGGGCRQHGWVLVHSRVMAWGHDTLETYWPFWG